MALRPVPRHSLRWAALGAAAALVLTGCGQSSPRVAAYVGSSEITDAAVTDGVEGFTEVAGAVNKPAVLNAMIQGEIATAVAAENGITVTDAERDELLAQDESAQVLLSNPAAKEVVYDLVDVEIVAGKVGDEKFLAAMQEADVTVNPRFGTWDPEAQPPGLQDGSSSLSLPSEGDGA